MNYLFVLFILICRNSTSVAHLQFPELEEILLLPEETEFLSLFLFLSHLHYQSPTMHTVL